MGWEVDLVYAPVDYNGTHLLLSEFRRIKRDPYLLVSQHLDTAYALSKDNKGFKKAFGVYPKIDDPSFGSRFEKKYGKSPRVYAEAGYDAFMFLAKAIQAGVNFNDPQAKFEYQGITGVHVLPALDRALVKDRAQVVGIRDGTLLPFEGLITK